MKCSPLCAEFHSGRVYIAQSPRDSVVTAGDGIQFDCAVVGMSDGDSLTWWQKAGKSSAYRRVFVSHPNSGSETVVFDSKKFEIRGHYSLYIKNATLEDGGSYMCEVTGLLNQTAELTVIGWWRALRYIAS